MAVSTSSPAPLEIEPEQSHSENQGLQPNQTDPSPLLSSSSESLLSSDVSESPNSNSNPPLITPPPALVQSFTPTPISPGAIPPVPSFRAFWPATPTSAWIPQFSSISNPNMQNPNFQIRSIQNPGVQPPGVNPVSIVLPGVVSEAGAFAVYVLPLRTFGMYHGTPSASPYPQTMPAPAPQGTVPPSRDATEDKNDDEMTIEIKTTSEEYQWQHERERKCKREIIDQEDESDDDNSKKRRCKNSMLEELRQWENKEDVADLREEEEIGEEKRTIEEQLQHKTDPKHVSDHVYGGSDKTMMENNSVEGRHDAVEKQSYESDSVIGNHHTGDVVTRNGGAVVSTVLSVGAASDIRLSSNAPVHSGFHEDDANKEKKMRPLSPIDDSAVLAVQPSTASGETLLNLAAEAEFGTRISNVNPKEEGSEVESELNRRSADRLFQQDPDQIDVESRTFARDADREKSCDSDCYLKLTFDSKKLILEVKQLIDMIPKTKEEVFSYEINWALSDKHELPKKMRPWISKKVMKVLEEDEIRDVWVDYVVSSIEEHLCASQMLWLLEDMLRDEAGMFFLKLWRMLIFEIKKVEIEAEFSQRIPNVNPKEKWFEVGSALNIQSGDGLSQRDRDRNDLESSNRARDVKEETIRESDSYHDLLNLLKTFDRKKLLEVEEFIDRMPKTKEELFSYDIDWTVSDKHELQKKMRPWISKEMMEEVEKDGANRVDYVITTLKDHVCSSQMVKLLYEILDEETEMFVLNMLRKLIFEIKKVETELAERISNAKHKEEMYVECSGHARDVNKERNHDSDQYRKLLNILKRPDSEQLVKIRRIMDRIPKTKKELFYQEFTWDVHDDKPELLHESFIQWISKEMDVLWEEEATLVADYIVSTIKYHGRASRIVELLLPILGDKSEKLVRGLWERVIFVTFSKRLMLVKALTPT